MKFPHEEAFEDFNTTYQQMPKTIKGKINNWDVQHKKVYGQQEIDPVAERNLMLMSAVIADEIQDFVEKDLEEDQEEVTPPAGPEPNTKTMLSDADKHRASKLGLNPETATVAEIEAKEKEIADKEAADKAAAEKAAADAKAKEEADKKAKEQAQAEDDDDILDGLM